MMSSYVYKTLTNKNKLNTSIGWYTLVKRIILRTNFTIWLLNLVIVFNEEWIMRTRIKKCLMLTGHLNEPVLDGYSKNMVLQL